MNFIRAARNQCHEQGQKTPGKTPRGPAREGGPPGIERKQAQKSVDGKVRRFTNKHMKDSEMLRRNIAINCPDDFFQKASGMLGRKGVSGKKCDHGQPSES